VGPIDVAIDHRPHNGYTQHESALAG
jgi:hypothetical protein